MLITERAKGSIFEKIFIKGSKQYLMNKVIRNAKPILVGTDVYFVMCRGSAL